MKNALITTLALGLVWSLTGCVQGGDFEPTDKEADAVDVTHEQDAALPDLAVEEPPPPAACASDEACGAGKVCVKIPPVTHETLLAGTHPDMGECVLYPEGPYGRDKGDIIGNISFFDTFTKQWVFLHDYYNNPNAKMLVIASGAGWCPPCQAEAADMVGYFTQYQPTMQVIYALFEDAGTPTSPPHRFYSTPGDHEQVNAFMTAWKDNFEVNYTLVADPWNYTDTCKAPSCDQLGENCVSVDVDPPCDRLHSYYQEGGIPFSVIVTTKDMRIRFVDHGYSKAQVEYNILKYVFND